MEYSLDAMQTALRVLRALTSKRCPEPCDVEVLRKHDGAANAELDELACDVTQKALKHRARVREVGY